MELNQTQIHVDTETLGTAHNSKLLSIGAVWSDREFYEEVDTSLYDDKFITCEATLAWWKQQGGFKPTREPISPMSAIAQFAKWVGECLDDGATEIWANSPSFDCEILKYHMGHYAICCPWKFWQERDVRTVKAMAEQLNLGVPKYTNPHHALHDAKNQRQMTTRVFETLVSNQINARSYLENNYPVTGN